MKIYKGLESLGFFKWLSETHNLSDTDMKLEYLDELPVDDIHRTVCYSMVFRWSREKHQLKVEPLYWYEGSELVYFVYIGRKDASKKGTNFGFNTRPYKINVKSYEEAELVCIDKLIEILKERQDENIK